MTITHPYGVVIPMPAQRSAEPASPAPDPDGDRCELALGTQPAEFHAEGVAATSCGAFACTECFLEHLRACLACRVEEVAEPAERDYRNEET